MDSWQALALADGDGHHAPAAGDDAISDGDHDDDSEHEDDAADEEDEKDASSNDSESDAAGDSDHGAEPSDDGKDGGDMSDATTLQLPGCSPPSSESEDDIDGESLEYSADVPNLPADSRGNTSFGFNLGCLSVPPMPPTPPSSSDDEKLVPLPDHVTPKPKRDREVLASDCTSTAKIAKVKSRRADDTEKPDKSWLHAHPVHALADSAERIDKSCLAAPPLGPSSKTRLATCLKTLRIGKAPQYHKIITKKYQKYFLGNP